MTGHFEMKKHKENLKCAENNHKINFAASSSNDAVMRAECLFTSFILEHNLPINCADHTSLLFKNMFPDSTIAKKYACARTKTTSIIGEMGNYSEAEIIHRMKNGPFSIATDGSNESEKYYPLVVTYFDVKSNMIQPFLYRVPVLSGDSTGKNISELILDCLKEQNIPLTNCIVLSVDNVSIMIGKNNSVLAFLRQEIEHLQGS